MNHLVNNLSMKLKNNKNNINYFNKFKLAGLNKCEICKSTSVIFNKILKIK